MIGKINVVSIFLGCVSATFPFLGPFLESYAEGFLSKLDLDARAKLLAQLVRDREDSVFAPNVFSRFAETTPLGVITLGLPIHRGKWSTVYEIRDMPDKMIKYGAHCRFLDTEIHGLLRDAWYMNETNSLGLSPRVHYVSPPSTLCLRMEGKCAFTMPASTHWSCLENSGSLRYMIMDRFEGLSLHTYRRHYFRHRSGAMPFSLAMEIGMNLLQTIRRLHEYGRIVHGDIHSPNVMIHRQSINGKNDSGIQLNLIDFERSFRYPESPLPTEPIYPFGEWYDAHFTQWQIDGFAWSARDDVMKATQTTVHLMHPLSYFDMETYIANQGYQFLKDWNEHGEWFFTDRFDPVRAEGFPDVVADQITNVLQSIMRVARNMTLNDPPPYDTLIGLFGECVDIANRSRVVDLVDPASIL